MLKTEIVPAVLEKSWEQAHVKLNQLRSLPNLTLVQVDFCDGKFTDSSTFEPGEMSDLIFDFEIEAHLMVVPSSIEYELLKVKGFSRVLFHFESFRKYDDLNRALIVSKHFGLKTGLAVAPSTSVQEVLGVLNWFDYLTLVSVEPGLQGRDQVPGIESRIQQFKNLFNGIIEVDGGVKASQVAELQKVGVDRIVVGSALWKGDLLKNWKELNSMLV